MDHIAAHPVPRIDDTVTLANLHERAEAVAIPNFNYVEQIVAGMTDALMSLGRRRRTRHRARQRPDTDMR